MKIYNWFIPNKKNKFHPVALRPLGLSFMLAVLVLIPPTYNIVSAKQFQVLGYATNVTVGDLYALSNQERANNGLGALALNSQLNNAAAAKANDMMSNQYWAHVSPSGTTPWSFITAAGYSYAVAGENLAKNFNTSGGVVAGWMASPAHRDNIISTAYQDVGYAVLNGVLQGSETTLVVAMYASKPASVAPTPAPSANTSPPPQSAAPTPSSPPVAAPTPEPTPPPTQSIAKDEPEVQPKETILPVQTTAASKPAQNNLAAVPVISAYTSFNWGQKVSLLLMSALALLFVMKHTVVWREQKRGVRHIWLRAHPIGQASALAVVIIITIANGAGVIL